MDEIVKAAMAKWPKVPHCYGWLGLDARGRWFCATIGRKPGGAFASGASGKNALLTHDKLIAFIGRNYACDANGCWYFQNGPQRVYVELQSRPGSGALGQAGAGQSYGLAGPVAQLLCGRIGPCVPGHRPWLWAGAHAGCALHRPALELGAAGAAGCADWMQRNCLRATVICSAGAPTDDGSEIKGRHMAAPALNF